MKKSLGLVEEDRADNSADFWANSMRGNARGMKAKLSRKELDDLFSEVLRKKKKKKRRRGRGEANVGTFFYICIYIYFVYILYMCIHISNVLTLSI